VASQTVLVARLAVSHRPRDIAMSQRERLGAYSCISNRIVSTLIEMPELPPAVSQGANSRAVS
jgi:hypothetical protein